MRIILKVKSNKDTTQKECYDKFYTSMHGFIFSKLQKTKKFEELHKETKFKPFCFSNIFPIKNKEIKLNEEYTAVISSPNPEFVQELFFNLNENELINLGEFSFNLESFYVKNINLKNNSILENITPINITIHENNKINSIKFGHEKYLNSLKKNLINKYNYFNKEKIEENFDLFKNVEIKEYEKRKETSFPIYFFNKEKNKKFDVIGSKLIFKLNNISEEQLKIFQLCFDTGFGERTSYGAGFMIERWKK